MKIGEKVDVCGEQWEVIEVNRGTVDLRRWCEDERRWRYLADVSVSASPETKPVAAVRRRWVYGMGMSRLVHEGESA